MSWRKLIWISWRKPFPAFTTIVKFSFQLVYKATSLYHVNIPLSIILSLFIFLVRRMEFALQFLNQNISGLSKSHGDDQVAMKHLARCSLQTSGLTSWQLLEPISEAVVCLKEHVWTSHYKLSVGFRLNYTFLIWYNANIPWIQQRRQPQLLSQIQLMKLQGTRRTFKTKTDILMTNRH